MKNEITYTEAFEELKEIVNRMEEGSVNLDELSTYVKRASELIQICKSKLHETEQDVNKILKDLSSNSGQDTSNG
ncbi:MAG: exodeoxyribonuclease VII small subunit [Bacteroidetes bacterium]|nr:exodeoxyribonuclease VII small subunit [Bacteroidota bacterium]MBM3417737.1 exodeoxyribonuclease VII small subunit [Bacteroidota bacterium]